MSRQSISQAVIKFLCSTELKKRLQALALDRGITLSALIKLALTEYVKSKG